MPGCHTWGRSLRQIKRRIREALSLWVEHAARPELDFREHLAREMRRELAAVRAAREKAGEVQAEAVRVAATAVRDLTKRRGLSVRDAADLIGVSHQRVQQLASMRARPARAIANKSTAGRAVAAKKSSASGGAAAKSVGRARSSAAARRSSGAGRR